MSGTRSLVLSKTIRSFAGNDFFAPVRGSVNVLTRPVGFKKNRLAFSGDALCLPRPSQNPITCSALGANSDSLDISRCTYCSGIRQHYRFVNEEGLDDDY